MGMVPNADPWIEDRNVTKKVAKIVVALMAPTRVADLLVFSQKVHDGMAADTKDLPSPVPALSVLQTHIDDLRAKETLAQTKAVGAVSARNTAEKVLRVDLASERGYVEVVVNADPDNAAEIAQDAGMQLAKVGLRTKPLLAVKPGPTSGSVHAVAKATQGAGANEWQYSTDGGKTWLDAPSTTRASTVIVGLTPMSTVLVRQRVVTKLGVSDWSVPVPHVVS